MNKKLSVTFDLLRFPLAVLVVFLHIAPVINTTDAIEATTQSEYVYMLSNMIVCKIATCAVPAFFLMSGYLMMINIKNLTLHVYVNKLKNRFKTLIIPYLLWNILAVIYLYATQQIDRPLTLPFVFLRPANFPLWFLRDLILLTSVFPLFYIIGKVFSRWAVCFVVMIFIAYPMPDMTAKYICIPIFFYFIGCWAGINKISLDGVSTRFQMAIVLLALSTLCYEVSFGGMKAWYADGLFLCSGTLSFFIIGNYLIEKYNVKPVGYLASGSFFVYCAHKLGVTYISKIGFSYLDIDSGVNQLMIFLVSPFITAFLCICIYRIGKRLCPGIMNVLTGGK